MGTTPKPLRILALPPVDSWPEVAALAAQGHKIHTLTDLIQAETTIPGEGEGFDYDVILGPQCWRMDEQHRKYFKLAVEEARRARYPVKGKKNA